MATALGPVSVAALAPWVVGWIAPDLLPWLLVVACSVLIGLVGTRWRREGRA